MYLPSNGAFVNVVDRDLKLYFQGHRIAENLITLNIWKTVKLALNAQERRL